MGQLKLVPRREPITGELAAVKKPSTKTLKAPTEEARPVRFYDEQIPRPAPMASEFSCELCKDRGWLRANKPLGDPMFGKLVPCRCKESEGLKKVRSQTYTWLGIGTEEADALEASTFETFRVKYQVSRGEQSINVDLTDVYQKSRGYAAVAKSQVKGQQNVLFAGTFGAGKTHLACAILNELRADGVSCLFATAIELFEALYAASFEDKQRIIDRAATTQVLCLDDLDKLHVKPVADPEAEEPGSYQKSVLFDLLNRRYRAKLPTIITTNKTDDLKVWLHGSVISRLFGSALAIGMKGPDYRQIARK